MKNYAVLLCTCILSLASTLARADQITVLRTASTYGVLAASTITNSGPTVVHGDLGLYSGTSITGFLPGTVVNGTMHVTDTQAEQAIADAQTGFTYLSTLSPTRILTGTDLNGLTLGPGVYLFATSAALNGNLTLDFGHLNNADIVFRIGTSFTTSIGSQITVVNQGTNDNVYYAVGTSASLGGNSLFAGDILAGTSIDLGTGAGSSCGSLTAIDGAVTLLSNNINNCSSTGSNVTAHRSQHDVNPVPEPATFGLLLTSLLGGSLLKRNKIPRS